jgi:TonB family protein
MSRSLAFALALTFAFTPLDASAQKEISSLAAQIRPSVVAVFAYDGAGGVAASGVGFFVSESGLLLTRACLFRRSTRAEIKTADGTSYPLTKLIDINSGQSLVLLAADVGTVRVKSVATNSSAPQLGEEVLFFADAISSDSSYARGRVTDTWHTKDGIVFEVRGPAAPVSEATPVFNLRGEVVGVAGALNSEHGTFFANAGESLGRLSAVAKSASGSSAKTARPLGEQFASRLSPPKLGAVAKRITPTYPQTAKLSSITGEVIVEVTVNEKGRVISAQMIKGDAVFKVESEAAALRWEFAPTASCGLPVKVIRAITFTFNK